MFLEPRSVRVALVSQSLRQRTICYALVISLMTSLLLPSLAMAIAPESRILICTSQGYQWIDISEQQSPQLNTAGGPLEHCTFCSKVIDHSDLIFFAHHTLYLEQLKFRSKVRDFSRAQLNYSISEAQPRAPPFSS